MYLRHCLWADYNTKPMRSKEVKRLNFLSSSLPSHLLPSCTFMPKMEHLRMQYLRQNFQRLTQARAGAIEILIAVGQVDSPVAHGAEVRPVRLAGEGGQLLPRLRQVIAAG